MIQQAIAIIVATTRAPASPGPPPEPAAHHGTRKRHTLEPDPTAELDRGRVSP